MYRPTKTSIRIIRPFNKNQTHNSSASEINPNARDRTISPTKQLVQDEEYVFHEDTKFSTYLLNLFDFY